MRFIPLFSITNAIAAALTEIERAVVSTLRRKPGDDSGNLTHIFTEPRIGYWMPDGGRRGASPPARPYMSLSQKYGRLSPNRPPSEGFVAGGTSPRPPTRGKFPSGLSQSRVLGQAHTRSCCVYGYPLPAHQWASITAGMLSPPAVTVYT